MKKLILLSAALMTAALIYGSIDFIKANRNGELEKIYSKNSPMKKSATTNNKTFLVALKEIGQPKTEHTPEYFQTAEPLQEIAVTPEEERPDISFEDFSRGEPDFEEVAVDSESETQITAEVSSTDSLPVSIDSLRTETR